MMTHVEKRDREITICQLMADGLSRKEIAFKVKRTSPTIDRILVDMKNRHKVATDSALIAKLMREGMIA